MSLKMPFSIEKELRESQEDVCVDIANQNLAALKNFLNRNYDESIVVRDDSRLAYLWATGQIVAEVDEISE